MEVNAHQSAKCKGSKASCNDKWQRQASNKDGAVVTLCQFKYLVRGHHFTVVEVHMHKMHAICIMVTVTKYTKVGYLWENSKGRVTLEVELKLK